MKLQELEKDIQTFQERCPSGFHDICKLTAPMYFFHENFFSSLNKLSLERYQLNNTEVDVLYVLFVSPNKEHILSPTAINEKMLFTSGAITKVLKKLEEKGFIKRLENSYDKRSKLVQLTAEGKAIFEEAMQGLLEYESGIFSVLNKEEQASFRLLYEKLLSAL